jgi:large subunit ribosomal protein L1
MAKKQEEIVEDTNVEETTPVVEEVAEEKTETKAKKADKKSKRATKKVAARKETRSVKYRKAVEEIERTKRYNVSEAVTKAQAGSYSKFAGTVELHVNTAQKNMRGLISLPFATGRKLTVLAFGTGAEESGADIIGNEEKVAAIQKGKVDFDVVVTTPDWMPKLAKIAAILGPRGLMPNPKSGTITNDLKKAVTEIQSGKVEYKTDRNAQVMHLSIGKTTQASEEIVANIKTLINSIGKTRIKKLVVAPTMGPGVKVDMSSL